MTKLDRRNKYCFGLGTIGRDMFYSLESMYLLFFLTEVRQLDDAMLALVGGVLEEECARVLRDFFRGLRKK